MAYDPQRNRARARPAGDQPAPVDMVLEGVVPVEAVEPAPVLDVRQEPAAVTVGAHDHGPDCDHDHDHGPDLRLIVAAGFVTVTTAAWALRRRRAKRR